MRKEIIILAALSSLALGPKVRALGPAGAAATGSVLTSVSNAVGNAAQVLSGNQSSDNAESNSGTLDKTDKPGTTDAPGKPDKGKPVKPPKPDRPGDLNGKPSDKAAISALKADFRVQAEEYQKKQKELLSQMKKANAEERSKLRDELQDLKAKFKDLRQELGDKIAELKPKIDKEVLEDARDHGRPRK
jgi:hypothetical protein